MAIRTSIPATKFLKAMGKAVIEDATTSDGLPIINLGNIRYPRLQLIAVFALTRLVSTATSQAELPPPMTKTFDL